MLSCDHCTINVKYFLSFNTAALTHTCRAAFSAPEQKRFPRSSPTMVLFLCKTEKRIFVTFDFDSSDIRAYPPGTHPGIMVIRLDDQSLGETLSTINKKFSLPF